MVSSSVAVPQTFQNGHRAWIIDPATVLWWFDHDEELPRFVADDARTTTSASTVTDPVDARRTTSASTVTDPVDARTTTSASTVTDPVDATTTTSASRRPSAIDGSVHCQPLYYLHFVRHLNTAARCRSVYLVCSGVSTVPRLTSATHQSTEASTKAVVKIVAGPSYFSFTPSMPYLSDY